MNETEKRVAEELESALNDRQIKELKRFNDTMGDRFESPREELESFARYQERKAEFAETIAEELHRLSEDQ